MTVRCTDLRTERLVDPIGLGTAAPRLTWRLEVDDGETDVAQSAAQVEVDGWWDSGRIDGWRPQVTYAGPTLASRLAARWRVRAWTTVGATEWSGWATFETGLFRATEWVASMVTAEVDTPVVRFSRVVDVPDDVVRARLRVTSHGIHAATIDGVEVSDEVLAPGWTSYHRRLAVRTTDVTDHILRSRDSAELAVLVAPGWFSGRLGFEGKRGLYGSQVGVLAQLELERGDGSLVVLGTDDSWVATATPFLAADLYDGETYDARLPLAGEGAPVEVVGGFDPSVLVAPAVPPVRRTDVVQPVSRTGRVIDFGQNLVGWLRIALRGAPAGTEVVLRHAEVLDGEGGLFTAPLRTAQATDRYVTSGADEEVYEPRFTFHGFRYAEVTGIPPEQIEVVAVVIHSDLERTGSFACSDPLVERLHENVVWGQRGNFVSVPTDCPQRDERLGWTGDAQVFSPTASFLYDCETFWENWLADLAADQHANGAVPHVIPEVALDRAGAAGWGDAAVVVPWSTYLAYGDAHVLRQALPSMRAWVDYVASRLDAEHRWMQDFQFGDWLDPDAPIDKPFKAKARFDLVASAYAVHATALLARAAAVVGEGGVATAYGARAEELRASWWRNFGDRARATQSGAALAIAFGLPPDEEARVVLGDELALRVHEAGDHLATGFLGTPVLLPALTATGHLDIAYAVLLQRTQPSWLAQVLAGATTIWERWDALRPDGSVPLEALGGPGGSGGSMVSFNHYAYGAVADWLHGTVAGLRPDPDDPGYHHVLVEPRPGGGLTSASASLATRFGRVAVGWRLPDGDGPLEVDVEIPPNAAATVTLPGEAPVRVGSGSHRFVSAPHPHPHPQLQPPTARAIEAALVRYYDQESADRADRAVDPQRAEARASFVARLSDEGRRALLEIGIGPGRDAATFVERGIPTVGVDLSFEHARRATAVGAGVAVGSVRALPFGDATFDCLWSMSTLMHVPDTAIEAALDEVRRVLAPGAVAAIGVWGGPDVEDHSDADRYDPPRFFSRRSDARWQALLRRVFEIEAFDSWWRDDDFWYQWAVVRAA